MKLIPNAKITISSPTFGEVRCEADSQRNTIHFYWKNRTNRDDNGFVVIDGEFNILSASNVDRRMQREVLATELLIESLFSE